MKNNKYFLVVLMSVLLVIITFHIALFAKQSSGEVRFQKDEVTPTIQSVQTFIPILLIQIRPVSGST